MNKKLDTIEVKVPLLFLPPTEPPRPKGQHTLPPSPPSARSAPPLKPSPPFPPCSSSGSPVEPNYPGDLLSLASLRENPVSRAALGSHFHSAHLFSFNP